MLGNCLDSHNPALRILEQNRCCLARLPRSGSLFKAPSYTRCLSCAGHCFRSWEGAKLQQELQRSDSQSDPPPPLVHLRVAAEDGGFPREASNFRYYFNHHYSLLGIIRPNGEEKLPGVCIYVCGYLHLLRCGFGVPSSFLSLNSLLAPPIRSGFPSLPAILLRQVLLAAQGLGRETVR